MKKRGGNSERNSGHQRRLANLKGHEFKPGKSGNPAGRPPTRGLLAHLKSKLGEVGEGVSAEEMIVSQLVQMAVRGDLGAIRECFDRTEGKPKQSLDVNEVRKGWGARTDEEYLFFAIKGRWPEESEPEKGGESEQ